MHSPREDSLKLHHSCLAWKFASQNVEVAPTIATSFYMNVGLPELVVRGRIRNREDPMGIMSGMNYIACAVESARNTHVP